MRSYRTKQSGDVLSLLAPLRKIKAGGHVLLSIGDTCGLAVVGEDEAGKPCTTSTLVEVSRAELSLFVETGLEVDPL